LSTDGCLKQIELTELMAGKTYIVSIRQRGASAFYSVPYVFTAPLSRAREQLNEVPVSSPDQVSDSDYNAWDGEASSNDDQVLKISCYVLATLTVFIVATYRTCSIPRQSSHFNVARS